MDTIIEQSKVRVMKADGSRESDDRLLIREHPFTVFVNEEPVFHLVCTRSHLEELVFGRLYTEGLIKGKEEVLSLMLDQKEEEARVVLGSGRKEEKAIADSEEKGTVSVTESDRNERGTLWKPEWIFMLADRFQEDSLVHLKTQGSHSCILARRDQILFSCEDIGRHNIIDKAVGYALLHDIQLNECILYLSGRIPVDMAKKVIRARIPVLVSKAVPTAQAVKLAGEHGLILICRAYPDQFEVYS